MGLAGQEREPVFEPGREWVPGASYPGLYGDDETTFALLRAEHSGSHDGAGAPGEGEEAARLAATQAMSTTAAADRASCAVEDSPLEKNWYIRYFLGRPHVNYIGLDEVRSLDATGRFFFFFFFVGMLLGGCSNDLLQSRVACPFG